MFFPGCKYIYDDKLHSQLTDLVEVLLKADVDIGYLGNADACCGGRALQMGFEDAFQDRAVTNMKIFKTAGVKTIVTPCSDCYYAFKHNYAQLGMDIEVLHIVEFIELLINEGKMKFTKPVPLSVTYHDPCHLGRLGETYEAWKGEEKKIFDQIHTWEPRRPRYNGAKGIYDAPRNIIKAIPGVTLVEMDRIREYSWCCGAGGGCSVTLPEFSKWTAGERITEANATGAQALITACPWCESNFDGVADKNGISIPVLDIVQLIQKAL